MILLETLQEYLRRGWAEIQSGETWTYASADGNIGTITVPAGALTRYEVGQKIRLVQSATTKYFIIHVITDTTLVVWGGTDYTLTNTAISDVFISTFEDPFGFPHEPNKWHVEMTDTSLRTQASPVSGTVYNLGSLSIVAPIGHWLVTIKGFLYGTRSNAGGVTLDAGLSTATNTLPLPNLLLRFQFTTGGNATFGSTLTLTEEDLFVTTKTTYYLNARATAGNMTDLNLGGNQVTTRVTLDEAYL